MRHAAADAHREAPMKLVITINMDNDAFAGNEDTCLCEAARILEEAVAKVRDEGSFPKKLFDINGNSVGTCSIKT